MSGLQKKLKTHIYSINTSMVLYFVLLICIVILLVSILSYTFSIQDFEQLSIRYTESLIVEINAGVDSYIDNVKSMSSVICENKDVQDLMALYDHAHGTPLSGDDALKVANLRGSAMRHLRIVAGTRSEITNIAVISKYRDILLSDGTKQPNPYAEYNLTDWFLKPLSYKENIVVSPSHVQNLVSGDYRWVISISRAVLDPQTGEVTGVMVIDLSFFAIKAICETAQLGQNGYAYLIDDEQNIIYHPQQQLIYAGIKVDPSAEILKMSTSYLRTEENKIYTKNTSALTGWTAVGVINAGELLRDRIRIVNFYFTLSGLCLLFATLAALVISSTVTKPLKELESTMHRVEEGDLSIQANTCINNEIGHLGKTFNTMIAKIKALMDTAVSNEEAKRKSEINALQAQINPHFLYNTLDSIIWMSASGKSEEVTEMTEALAKLFRTSISQGENDVPLRNEMENIKSYLTIQKMRYGDKLAFELDVNERYLRYMVPKLILQPIVENALYHGIKLSPQAGTIRIGAFETEQMLVLTVSDNGVGMTAEQLSHIFEAKENGERGIGIL
ncbi:MAG: sensor histidine kinase, partial [Ruthenibacterium sp.]